MVRDAPPASGPPPGDESDPLLVERLRLEIERSGPITFARFMALALYDPDRGYYATADSRASRSGDFLSAPELHPVFGRLVARHIAACWERLGRPVPFVVREHGAGSGALAAAIVDGLVVDDPALLDALAYEPVEVAPDRVAAIADRVAASGASAHVRAPSEGPITGVVVANELLDALPVHRVEQHGGRLVERYVDWREGWFGETRGAPSTPRLAARLAAEGVTLAEGALGEVCLALDDWVAGVSASLRRGHVLVIDYGHPAQALYGPGRPAGTLLAYRGHRVHDDPFRDIGRQDLTAHVDLTALGLAARRNGLAVLGETTQSAFVAGLGAGDLLASAGQASIDDLPAYIDLRAAVLRLLDPRALGAFRVVLLGRDVPDGPPLAGFAGRPG